MACAIARCNSEESPVLRRVLARWLALGFFAALYVAQGQVPVVGGGTLESLRESGKLVTVVLNAENARDLNLKITGIYKSHITFDRANGTSTSYTIPSIKEIRVQDEKIDVSTQRQARPSKLSDDDEKIAENAVRRADELFDSDQGDQTILMPAAGILAAWGNQDALNGYLVTKTQQNDAELALEAAMYMYLAGVPVPPEVIERGLLSGKRPAKAMAATIAGLQDAQQFAGTIREMLKDTMQEIYPSAAMAAGRLKMTDGMEWLMRGFRARTPEKAEATVHALAIMGGPEVEAAIDSFLDDRIRQEWFRAVRVLNRIGNEKGKRLMHEALQSPAFRDEAALILAKDGDWDAQQELRKILDRPFDPYVDNLVLRAKNYGALLLGGDSAAKTELLNLMRIDPAAILLRENSELAANTELLNLMQIGPARLLNGGTGSGEKEKAEGAAMVKIAVCHVAAVLGDRSLMAVVQAGIGASEDPRVEFAACEAVTAIAIPEYAERLRNLRPVYP